MARPCGCGSGGVVVRCGTGLLCTGVGTAGDPLVISWEIPLGSVACGAVMDCVGGNLGSGLQYFPEAHRVAAKVSTDSGNMLGFGSDGGLLVTGSPDPSLGGVTIAGLPTDNVVGSSYGAGFQIYPDGYRRSYEVAMADEHIHLIHVPVRRSKELLLYAVHERNLGWYTNNSINDVSPQPAIPIRNTNEIDSPWSQLMIVRPSGRPDNITPDNPYNTTLGYFGYGHSEQRGILLLEDVFQAAARRKCMYLECRDIGGSGETPLPAFTFFHLVDLIKKWGLQKSVIVSAQLPTGDQDLAGIKQGLQQAKAAGIEIAAHLVSQAQATANPPASLVALGCTWVGLSYGIDEATMQTYIAAGLNVMLFTADRQWHWTRQQEIGARGAFTSDPIYTAAHSYGFRYRYINPPLTVPYLPFSGQAAKYGITNYSGSILSAHAKLRGWVDRETAQYGYGILKTGKEMTPPANSGFHIPLGPLNPIFDRNLPSPPPQGDYGTPTNYDIEVNLRIVGVNWQSGGQQALGLFFCVPRDVRLFDLAAASSSTVGYSFLLASDGNFVFRRYSGESGGPSYVLSWSSGWTPSQFVNGGGFKIAVQVRPGSIRCGPFSSNGGITGANSRLFTANSPVNAGGDLHRGPYVYASFWESPGFGGYRHFEAPAVTNFS